MSECWYYDKSNNIIYIKRARVRRCTEELKNSVARLVDRTVTGGGQKITEVGQKNYRRAITFYVLGDGRGVLPLGPNRGSGGRRGREARVEVPVPEDRGGVRVRVVVVALVEVERVAERVVAELARGRAPPPPPRPLRAASRAEATAHRGPQLVPQLRRGRRRRGLPGGVH
jgi:hypothetical protein